MAVTVYQTVLDRAGRCCGEGDTGRGARSPARSSRRAPRGPGLQIPSCPGTRPGRLHPGPATAAGDSSPLRGSGGRAGAGAAPSSRWVPGWCRPVGRQQRRAPRGSVSSSFLHRARSPVGPARPPAAFPGSSRAARRCRHEGGRVRAAPPPPVAPAGHEPGPPPAPPAPVVPPRPGPPLARGAR